MTKQELKEILNKVENWALFEELAFDRQLEFLPHADFQYVDLSRARFQYADLKYATFGNKLYKKNIKGDK